MYRNGRISKSSVACQDTSLSDNIALRKWGFPYYRDPLDPSSATKYIKLLYYGGHTYCRGTSQATTKIVRDIEVIKN